MSSTSSSTSSPNSAPDGNNLSFDNQSVSSQSFNLPSFTLPSIPVLSEVDLNSRIPASITPSSISSNVLIATPPVFLTLGFGKNMKDLEAISNSSDLPFQDLNLAQLKTPQCASEAPYELNTISYWSSQPGGMVIVDYYRRFPTLKGTSQLEILNFLLNFARHSAVSPHGFLPSMRPRIIDLCTTYFSSVTPHTCNEAIARLLNELPLSVISFFDLGGQFINAPSSFESEQGSTVIAGPFSRFNSLWELFLLCRPIEHLSESIQQVSAVFFKIFPYFYILRNRPFNICEIQQHLLQTASSTYNAVSLSKVRNLDPFYFHDKHESKKRIIESLQHDPNTKRKKISTSFSFPSSFPSSSSSSSSLSSSSSISRSDLVKNLKSYLSEHPLSAKNKSDILISEAYKNKLIDKNGIPIKYHCFSCGMVEHKLRECPNKKSKPLSAASPLVKAYYDSLPNSRKN